ncbi:hypothetical protein [Magnetospirillum sp. UT-4]|uniref:hypothetical protein n=1 Tax=Magnetospirillum sp. UT-4 TaxID=2681467 RepID=UPI001383A095|nr:hypothetical protein [Magnetospirillum sp. UT-4]CAA7612780.1 conserved hypothetical protein [Magnetospirillum sp. UT-4]
MSAVLVAEELEKAASMVTAARRLLATGTMVDLSALEGRVRLICETLAAMEREEGQALLPVMERLIADLDRLAAAITERMDPPPPDTAPAPDAAPAAG